MKHWSMTGLVWIIAVSVRAQEEFLNLEEADLEEAVEVTTAIISPLYSVGGPLGLAAVFFGILFFLKWLFPFKVSPEKFNIQTYPSGVKRGLTLGLMVYGIAFLLGTADIVYQTTYINESTEAYFQNFSLGRLIGFSHAHLFGLTTSFLIIGIPFSMQFGHSRVYQWILVIGMAAAIVDIASWWGIKYIAPTFEMISTISGVLFSASYLFMLIALLRVLLFPFVIIRVGKQIL